MVKCKLFPCRRPTESKSCTLKFVNSFARRQRLFDIAATPIDIGSNILSYPAVLPCPRSSVIIYQSYGHDIFKRNEPILLQIGTVFHGAKEWNDQFWGSGGQRSGSHDAEVRFRDLAEASFSTLRSSRFSSSNFRCWLHVTLVTRSVIWLRNTCISYFVCVFLCYYVIFCCLLA